MFLSKQEELCKKLRRTKTPINMAKINLSRTPIVLTFLIKKIILLKISLHFTSEDLFQKYD